MSQNGPYPGQGWSAGGSSGADEPYTEPADPWGDAATHAAPVPDNAWGGQPMSVPPSHESSAGYHTGYPGESMADPMAGGGMTGAPLGGPPMWQQQPPPSPKRRNAPIIVLVVVLGMLIVGGLATAAWLVQRTGTPGVAQSRGADPATAPTTGAAPEPRSSEDARFVGKGQCVRNEGSADDSPDLKIVSCASGTYQVLRRVDGRTTGEADAESKCSKVSKYTKWYFYDSELDSLDFVLCLREYDDN